MTQLITRMELEDLEEMELRSKFADLTKDLHRTQAAQFERTLALASLENVQAALNRRRMMRPKV